MFDTWREYNRECTSFVAWALHSRNHYDMPFYANAVDWKAKAQGRGIAVDGTPAVGAVAYSSSGHVAWVAAVGGGSVTIEEYNHTPYAYDWRSVPTTSFEYIHFADLANDTQPQPGPTVTVNQPGPTIVIAGPPNRGSNGSQGSTIHVQGGSGPIQGGNGPVQGGNGPIQGGNVPVQGQTTHAPPPQVQPQPSMPVYTVMNTSETAPDGVYFRNSPSWNDTSRIYADGVFMGDQVRVRCYAWGDAVGSYSNRLWYFVDNVSRPTVPSNGAANSGYLNAHYINDGADANQIDPGVPAC